MSDMNENGNNNSPTNGNTGGNDSNGDQEPSFLGRIKGLFASDNDTSLRASLEGVIEQHGDDGAGNGIKPKARSMMLNLIDFTELRVDDVMVPRADIIATEQTINVRDILALFITANHSRLPVYNDVLDDPVGMVHIKDLLRWIKEHDGKPSKSSASKSISKASKVGLARKTTRDKGLMISAKDLQMPITKTGIIREILFVPPSMPAGDLLVKMQSTHIHMAVVVDEYGGTDGLVSIEDVVEEIVGDIADEHDGEETPPLQRVSSDSYIADARADIEEVEKELQIDLLPDDQEEDADTLGGLIFAMLGRVPVRGELVKHPGGIEFEILEADPRRVQSLKIRLEKSTVNSGDSF